MVAISDDLRRRLDVLFAFVRQSVRECTWVSVCVCSSITTGRSIRVADIWTLSCLTAILGFDPDSELRNVPFTNQTYYLDPVQPQLADLLTREEAERSVRDHHNMNESRARVQSIVVDIY